LGPQPAHWNMKKYKRIEVLKKRKKEQREELKDNEK
jgi:hypothetical protein